MITKQERIEISKLIEAKRVYASHLNQAADEIKESAAFAYVRASDELEAYLDSLVEPEDTTAANDGWIEWKGGDCPVEKGTRVDVRFRDGKEIKNIPAITDGAPAAHQGYWVKEDMPDDIVAYRIV